MYKIDLTHCSIDGEWWVVNSNTYICVIRVIDIFDCLIEISLFEKYFCTCWSRGRICNKSAVCIPILILNSVFITSKVFTILPIISSRKYEHIKCQILVGVRLICTILIQRFRLLLKWSGFIIRLHRNHYFCLLSWSYQSQYSYSLILQYCPSFNILILLP